MSEGLHLTDPSATQHRASAGAHRSDTPAPLGAAGSRFAADRQRWCRPHRLVSFLSSGLQPGAQQLARRSGIRLDNPHRAHRCGTTAATPSHVGTGANRRPSLDRARAASQTQPSRRCGSSRPHVAATVLATVQRVARWHRPRTFSSKPGLHSQTPSAVQVPQSDEIDASSLQLWSVEQGARLLLAGEPTGAGGVSTVAGAQHKPVSTPTRTRPSWRRPSGQP